MGGESHLSEIDALAVVCPQAVCFKSALNNIDTISERILSNDMRAEEGSRGAGG